MSSGRFGTEQSPSLHPQKSKSMSRCYCVLRHKYRVSRLHRGGIEKFLAEIGPFHFFRFFQGLSRVESAKIKQFESAFDFISLRLGKSGASKPDRI